MINRYKFYKIIYIMILALLSFFIYQSTLFNDELYTFNNSYDFSSSWKMSIEGTDIEETINLPYNTNKNTRENTISIENMIPKKYMCSPYIMIGSSQQSFKVYIENKLIYNFDSIRAINNGKTGGAVWKIIELPDDCFGKNIRIEFKSSYLRTSGALSNIKLGTKEQLVSELFSQTIIDQRVSTVLFILVLFIIYINIRTRNIGLRSNHIYLTLAILDISTWISCESQFYAFIYNNYALIYYIEFIALFSFPIFLYKYLLLEYNLKPKELIKWMYKLHIYLMLLLTIGQLLGFMTFFEGQWLFLGVLVISFFITIISIICQCRYNIKLRQFLYMLMIIFICLILDYLLYDIRGSVIKVSFLNIGIILIEILIVINIYKEFIKLNKEKEKSRYLELQLNYQLNHYSLIEEKNIILKRYRHDMTNHWMLVNRLIKNRKLNIAEEYSSKMAEQLIDENNLILDTGNPIIDAILTEKIKKANDLDIDISSDIVISKNIKIDHIDCCIIWGNILDNAIEACTTVVDKPYIKIELKSNNNTLICKVSNSIDKNKLILKDYKTTKNDKDKHGFGMTNIEKSVQKYNGYIDINHGDCYFEIGFILYNV